MDNTVVSILWVNADQGDYVIETLRDISETVESLTGLIFFFYVCIYYTLEEVKQNHSEFVSRIPLEYMSICRFLFRLSHIPQNRCLSHRKVG